METNLKALLISVGIIITCAILSIFLLFKKDAQRADSKIIDAYEEQQGFLKDDVTDYDGKTVDGGELLSLSTSLPTRSGSRRRISQNTTIKRTLK